MRVRMFAVTAVLATATALFVVSAASPYGASTAAETTPSAVALCNDLLDPVMGGVLPSSEPLAACQWDMLRSTPRAAARRPSRQEEACGSA